MAPSGAHPDSTIRAQALGLKIAGISNSEIQAQTGIAPRTLLRIYDRAIQRGLNLHERPCKILNSHVAEGLRPGRPTKQTPKTILAVTDKVRVNRYSREKTCQ